MEFIFGFVFEMLFGTAVEAIDDKAESDAEKDKKTLKYITSVFSALFIVGGIVILIYGVVSCFSQGDIFFAVMCLFWLVILIGGLTRKLIKYIKSK